MRFFGRGKDKKKEKKAKVESREPVPAPKKKDASTELSKKIDLKPQIPKKINVALPTPKGPTIPEGKVTERMSRIEKLLEEQKKLDAEKERRQTKKKKSGPPLILKPFAAVNHLIGSLFRTIFHGFFSIFASIALIPLHLGRLISRLIGSFLQGIYNRAGGVSPFGWKRKINQLIIYSGVNKSQEGITGITIVNGAVLGAFVFVMGYFLWGWDITTTSIVSISSFVLVWIITYSIINLMADKRTDEVEEALPDVLQIVSANISAGMTPYNALWVSARKEFGALAEEIKIAQKETLGGKAFYCGFWMIWATGCVPMYSRGLSV